MKPIYLDYNASTPVDPEVARAMLPFLEEQFGNPSSIHWYGTQTRRAIEKARHQIADLISCEPAEILFTSGGTESNNHAIKGTAFAYRHRGNHIITSQIEHPAVIEVCRYLEKNGFEITYLPVDENGLIDTLELERSLTSRTILISIMHANNEVGTIQPLTEISKIISDKNIILHTDAAQSIGKIEVNVGTLGVDILSIAGHKVYAPKGIGALYLKQGVQLEKFMHGADHEQNLRAGTENVMEIVGLGKACEIAKENLSQNMTHMKDLRDRLYNGLKNNMSNIKLNGHPHKRLPNTLNISFKNIEANLILSRLKGVAVSAGAACHSDSIDISPVLTAMGIPMEYAMGTIRFSVGRMTTSDEIERAIKEIVATVKKIKPRSENQVNINSTETVRLTEYTSGLGCACKLNPRILEKILRKFPLSTDSNVLVGIENSDDASVYLLNENTALVQTVDFFTPIVDDPYDFGAISAANSLSDIYAMGATPLFALNVVAFPSNRLSAGVLEKILQGAQDKAREAGIDIIGGHTIDDTEPKFGLVVLGKVDPRRIITNSGAKPDDVLILTKPIGTGILATAAKRGLTTPELNRNFTEIMSHLNRSAAEIMAKYPVNACTDVTGFGLLGHLREMCLASNVNAIINYKKVPIFPEARDYIVANIIPGGSINNLEYVNEYITWEAKIDRSWKILLCDAQTSGGLLISLPENDAVELRTELNRAGLHLAEIIGRIQEEGIGSIIIKD